MEKVFLYHGTSDKIVTPFWGGGDDKHDYGRGFYLTDDMDLAKEWAVCKPNEENGWVHKYELDCEGLEILDFQERSIMSWLAELMIIEMQRIQSAIECWRLNLSRNMG